MYAHDEEQDEEPSIIELFQRIGNIPKENNQEKVSPLVSQAGEFVLIIDPPKPPAPIVVKKVEEKEPKVTPPPVVLAPRPSAKFKLLSTSCNRDRQEDSVALVSEGEHWETKGSGLSFCC